MQAVPTFKYTCGGGVYVCRREHYSLLVHECSFSLLFCPLVSMEHKANIELMLEWKQNRRGCFMKKREKLTHWSTRAKYSNPMWNRGRGSVCYFLYGEFFYREHRAIFSVVRLQAANNNNNRRMHPLTQGISLLMTKQSGVPSVLTMHGEMRRGAPKSRDTFYECALVKRGNIV